MALAPRYETYEDFPSEELYLYAGIDCVATSDLARALYPKLTVEPDYVRSVGGKKVKGKAMSIMESYERYMTDIFETIVDLESNGLSYDVNMNRIIGSKMVEEIGVLDDSIFSAIGHAVDQSSGPKLAEFLYGEMGFDVPSYTKGQMPSTDGDALKALAKQYGHEWLRQMAKRKDISGAHNTFIKTYVEDFVKRDGRIHPSYLLHGTSSFRISGENPNLTQLPRDKHGYCIRDCYNVPEGYIFLALDYKSAEVLCLASLCKDKKMLDALSKGMDFHTFSASEMYHIPYEELLAVLSEEHHPKYKEYKEYRQVSKSLGFAIIYGSTAGGIAGNLGITVTEAQRLIDLYFSLFPRIKDYVERCHAEALYNHFSVGPFGQRKMQYGTLPVFNGTAVMNAGKRSSQNFGCQNPTSTLGLCSFSDVNREIKPYKAKATCSVYDSLEMEVPISRAAEVLEVAFKYMVDEPIKKYGWMEIPIPADAEIGLTWGSAKHVKRGATQKEIEELIRGIQADT